jgi:hypothetical protein
LTEHLAETGNAMNKAGRSAAPLPTGRRRLGVAVLTALIAGSALAVGAGWVAPGAAGAAEPDAVVRGAHFSPTTPGVDVYLGSFTGGGNRLWLSSVTYGGVSPYQRIAPGLYTVSMRPAGAAPSTPPVLSWTFDAQPGAAYTVAGVGAGAAVRGVVIKDDLTTPPPGQGRLRVIQAASRAPTATVTTGQGEVLARSTSFGTATPYHSVPAGTWTVRAAGTGTDPVATSSSVAVLPGVSTSVLLLDAKTAGIVLRTVLDSSSSGTTPVGSVPAGGGGTSASVRAALTVGPAAGGVAALVALLAAAAFGLTPPRAYAGGRHVHR